MPGINWPYNTARWRRVRKAHLQREPMCRGCHPRLVIGSHVDHVKPISDGGDPFPSHDGLRTYCPACHSRKTARGVEAGAAKTSKAMKGCDANGIPLDPAHSWSGIDTQTAQQFRKKSLRAKDREARGYTNIELVNLTPPKAEQHGR